MAIPLISQPAIVDLTPKDMLSGDSAYFTATLGNWVAVGSGTSVTRVTSPKLAQAAGAMQFVADSNTDYCETTIPGVFHAGRRYWGIVLVQSMSMVELTLGVIGTDSASRSFATSSSGANPQWMAMSVEWVPSANRTGVKLRYDFNSGVSKTQYIGMARVIRSEFAPFFTVGSTTPASIVAPGVGTFTTVAPFAEASSTQIAVSGAYTYYESVDGESGMDSFAADAGDDAELYIYANTATTGDLAAVGIEIWTGPDAVGIYMSEKDSDTLQFYADTSGGYMMQLRHRGSGKGWAVSSDGTENDRIEAYFDVVLRKSGTLSATTNVCDYYCLPGKIKINEVRCHVGTAPTGQALIVDVHAGGTTIFTTQGNRPSIADGTNDDTSGTPDGGTSLAKDTVITVDVDQVGSGTAGADLYVHIRGVYIW